MSPLYDNIGHGLEAVECEMPVDETSAKIGELIASWRKAAGLSQTALAETMGTQQTTISKLESGSYKLYVGQLLDILESCGLSLSEVANDIEAAARPEGTPLWERIDE